MNQEQRAFTEMNDRTSPRVRLSLRAMLLLAAGEIIWFGIAIYLAAAGAIAGIAVFAMMAAGLLAPSIILSHRAAPRKPEQPPVKNDGSPFIN